MDKILPAYAEEQAAKREAQGLPPETTPEAPREPASAVRVVDVSIPFSSVLEIVFKFTVASAIVTLILGGLLWVVATLLGLRLR